MRLAILFLAACSLARADALSDLKATLATAITAHAPVRARVTFELTRQAEGEGDGKGGKIELNVEDQPDGLKTLWPRAVFDAAVAEERARASDRNAPTPTRQAMDALSATDLNDYLSAAGSLLRHLDQAALTGETTTEWQGHKARLLALKITPPLGEKDKKYIKEISVVGKIWIGEDGWPLAAEQTLDLKGRALLVISFEQHEKEEFRFVRIGDRLVTTYHLKNSVHSGAGEKGTERRVATIVPQQG